MNLREADTCWLKPATEGGKTIMENIVLEQIYQADLTSVWFWLPGTWPPSVRLLENLGLGGWEK